MVNVEGNRAVSVPRTLGVESMIIIAVNSHLMMTAKQIIH